MAVELSSVEPIRRHGEGELSSLIEAVLFSVGRPVSIQHLVDAIGVSESQVKRVLRSRNDSRGIFVAWDGTQAELVINPRYSSVVHASNQTDVDRSLSLIEEFLSAQRQRGRRPKTIESYRQFMSRFAHEVGRPVDEVETRDVRQFLLSEERRGNAQSTIASKIHRLNSLYKWFEREEILDRNPMRRIDAPSQEESEPKHLEQEELELVRMACKKPIERLLVEVLYSSGIRREETVKLDWSDVDFVERSLRVRDGKGGVFRFAPLSTLAVMLLRKYRKERADDAPWVFQSQFRQRMSESTVGRRMRVVGDRAGLEERLTPHRLRHSLATHLLAAGVPLDVVQKILGHKSISTTQVYARRQMRQVEQHYRQVFP